tara:strand:+ start:2397 stop:3125 length:729 start_codon:yes stop_codon:yes gene_type:complete
MSSITEKYYQLQDYSLMTVKGERSHEFIQGQVSCDISSQQEKVSGLFCDEKGYVITNATLFLDEEIKILIKEDVAEILEKELMKYSKFYKCLIKIEKADAFGKISNKVFEKCLGKKENSLSQQEWDREQIFNFCIDVDSHLSCKYRATQLGYSFKNFVSFEKGCYRGQEVISRLNYLAKTKRKCVVFKQKGLEILNNSDGRKIGEKVFTKIIGNEEFIQFFVEDLDFYHDDKIIHPVASQWV